MIRFLEARFGHHHPDLIESNITPWRRAIAGDLTTAFDFKTPNTSRRINLPGTDDFKPEDLVRQPDQVPVPPAHQRLPGQEPGVRPARAIPYTLDAHGVVHDADDSFQIHFRNTGGACAVFQVRSGNSADLPRTYTVEPLQRVTDTWRVGAIGASTYDLSVYGPNGFYRAYRGSVSGHRCSEPRGPGRLRRGEQRHHAGHLESSIAARQSERLQPLYGPNHDARASPRRLPVEELVADAHRRLVRSVDLGRPEIRNSSVRWRVTSKPARTASAIR